MNNPAISVCKRNWSSNVLLVVWTGWVVYRRSKSRQDGHVFRPPSHLLLFSALLGTGAQLAMLVLLVILLAILRAFYDGQVAIATVFIICYALTTVIAGYISGGFYSRNDGKDWMKSMLLSASFFPFLCFVSGFSSNIVAIYYESLAALPIYTMVVVPVIWAIISLPLAMFGTKMGRANHPSKLKTIPRHIPDKKWNLKPAVIALLSGLLPFGSIFIQMYFVFSSFGQYEMYMVYGFMLLIFTILSIVTASITIVATYCLLNAENYHWQWTSFWSGSSTALYVYLYSIYYYYMKTEMSGLFQTSFYFGPLLLFCIGLGIFCGAVGYLGSSLFVHQMYGTIKCD